MGKLITLEPTTASVVTTDQVVPRHRFKRHDRVRVIVHPATAREQMDNGTVVKVFDDGHYNVLGDTRGLFTHVPGKQVTPLP